jgi:HAD superfamily hydrolase (TIGR01549 family)
MAINFGKIAVLFDLEDTLVQTPWQDHQHVLEFRRETRRKLVVLGIPEAWLEGIERATLMRNRAAEYITTNFTRAQTERFDEEMEKFLKGYELDSATKSKLFPDTIPTLNAVRKLNVRIGLVTNTSREAVETVFKLHGLGEYFNVAITRENVKKLKPDPEGILLAIKKLCVQSFFMVGDLIHDALAAKSANGKAIIVRRKTENETDFSADYFVESLSEVPAIIQKAMKVS